MCIKHVRTCLKHNLMQRVDACVILKIYTNLKFVGLLDQLATDPGLRSLNSILYAFLNIPMNFISYNDIYCLLNY